jgi:hypothetical protein
VPPTCRVVTALVAIVRYTCRVQGVLMQAFPTYLASVYSTAIQLIGWDCKTFSGFPRGNTAEGVIGEQFSHSSLPSSAMSFNTRNTVRCNGRSIRFVSFFAFLLIRNVRPRGVRSSRPSSPGKKNGCQEERPQEVFAPCEFRFRFLVDSERPPSGSAFFPSIQVLCSKFEST